MARLCRIRIVGVVALVCGVIAALVPATTPRAFAKGGLKEIIRLRFVTEFDLLELDLLEDPNLERYFSRGGGKLARFYNKKSFSMPGECGTARQVISFLQNGKDPKTKLPIVGSEYDLQINAVVAAYVERAQSELDGAERFIDYLEQESFDTKKEQKLYDVAARYM